MLLRELLFSEEKRVGLYWKQITIISFLYVPPHPIIVLKHHSALCKINLLNSNSLKSISHFYVLEIFISRIDYC